VDGDPARASTVDDLLRELSSITGSGFKPEDTERFFENPRMLRVEGEDGEVLVEVAFFGDGTTLHAIGPLEGATFEIPDWRVDRLTPTPTLAREPPSGG